MVAFQLVQTLYWLGLSTWFGSVLFVGVAAPIIFRTVQQANPLIPTVLSVNLENQHGSLLAGSVVGAILRKLSAVQLGCAAVLLLMLGLQWLVMELRGRDILHAIIRDVLFVGSALMVLYDRYVVWPKLWSFRQRYIEHADEPELANPAREQFDHYHRESVRVLFVILLLLSLMIVFSTTVAPREAM